MDLTKVKSIYFVGAGGIGMSALIRYFITFKYTVGGYDKFESKLTNQLIDEGAQIHYEDNVTMIPDEFKDPATTLVVYTPAVPSDHTELAYFRENKFEIQKRAQILGEITKTSKGLCIAGTHGKTTISTLTSHIFNTSHVGCNSFIGGISKNFNTNFIANPKSEFTVIEACEYDRSFHWLNPYMSVITAVDADHLDIYGDLPAYIEGFEVYSSLVVEGGVLIMKKDINMKPRIDTKEKNIKIYTYSGPTISNNDKNSNDSENKKVDNADFYADNVRISKGKILFDYHGINDYHLVDLDLGVPMPINVENSVAAIALCQLNGLTEDEIREGIKSFKGVERRFDFKLDTDEVVFVNDYGHHPVEVKESILSMKEMFKGRKLTVAFQPHLFSRTNDFYKEFAESLSLADDVILFDIFPAREKPIEGVTSKLIFDLLDPKVPKVMSNKEGLVELIKSKEIEALLTLGAGDIDSLGPQIVELLKSKYKKEI